MANMSQIILSLRQRDEQMLHCRGRHHHTVTLPLLQAVPWQAVYASGGCHSAYAISGPLGCARMNPAGSEGKRRVSMRRRALIISGSASIHAVRAALHSAHACVRTRTISERGCGV